ncbi:MAG: hypothetical protein OES69_14575 [Myxococcales bacterium]|nr:hypothetical protein [Myxococcales bacterium]
MIDEYQDVDRVVRFAQGFARRYPIEIMLGTASERRHRNFMISVPETETAAVHVRVLKPRQ